MKNEKDRSALYKYLHKDIKEFNKHILSLVCVGILVGAGLLSYFITTSFALFTDTIVGEKTIEAKVDMCNQNKPNAPVLDSAMIPVYYDENTETWKKADSTNKSNNWYDYCDKKWANSVTVSSTNRTTYKNASPGTTIPMDDILTMQVWIPRYKYKVWNYNADGTKTSNPQEIEIVFEKETAKTGEITCSDTISGTDGAASETCKIGSTTCTDSTCNNKYYTHPAFTFGEEEISGFWIGKFEISVPENNACYTSEDSTNCNKTGITPLVKPNVKSYRNAQVGTFETNIMAMKDNGNIYGFSATTDTHMIKNMEWGAIAYLSHSKYGTCTGGTCEEVYKNNSSEYYTGRSRDTASASSTTNGTYEYNEIGLGTYASTTHNIYGVYDMSGGTDEYVMGNIVSNNGTTMMSGDSSSNNSGYTGIIYDAGKYTSYTGTYSYPNAKYYDKYSFGTSDDQRRRSKLGDSIKEVFNTSFWGWYSDASYLARSGISWFNRGGSFSNAGVFQSYYSGGTATSSLSSHLVVTS